MPAPHSGYDAHITYNGKELPIRSITLGIAPRSMCQAPIVYEGKVEITETIPSGVKFAIEQTHTVHGWVFPKDRFIEYGPEDEWWARKVDFGHAGMVACTHRFDAWANRVVDDSRDGYRQVQVDFTVEREMTYAWH